MIYAASWDPNKSSGNVPVIRGARNFSFDELKRYTNNFSEVNDVGSGGYGKVICQVSFFLTRNYSYL